MPSATIDRRDLLAGVGACISLAALGGCAGATRPMPLPADASRGRPVVVVGAGFSGLVIAYRLMQRGCPVKVLEATAVPGGRIRTIRGFADGLYVEAGATHIVGDPDLVQLLSELGMRGAPRPDRTPLAHVRYAAGRRSITPAGEAPPPDHSYSEDDTRLGEQGRMAKYLGAVNRIDPVMLRTMEWSAEIARLDQMTCADYLRSQGASPGFLADIDDMLPLGDGIETTSALEIVRTLAAIRYEIVQAAAIRAAAGGTGAGGIGRIASGSDAIPAALASRLGARIAYSSVVERIERAEHGATLVIRDRAGRHRLDAARVVLTMPYTAMRAIDVAPRWSPAKARAIAELGMTSVTRIWVASDRRGWLDRGEAGRAESDLPTGRILDETEAQPGRGGVLGVYAFGRAGHRLAALSPAARIAALTADVERVHPSLAGHIVHGDSVAWETEPFVRGAYAVFTPGQLTSLAAAAAAPEGVVHFAGCGTSYRPGFLHGALDSALRVLDEIGAAMPRDTARVG
jgi:monoamine oxidase